MHKGGLVCYPSMETSKMCKRLLTRKSDSIFKKCIGDCFCMELLFNYVWPVTNVGRQPANMVLARCFLEGHKKYSNSNTTTGVSLRMAETCRSSTETMLDSMCTHKQYTTLIVQGNPILTTHTDKYPSILQCRAVDKAISLVRFESSRAVCTIQRRTKTVEQYTKGRCRRRPLTRAQEQRATELK